MESDKKRERGRETMREREREEGGGGGRWAGKIWPGRMQEGYRRLNKLKYTRKGKEARRDHL